MRYVTAADAEQKLAALLDMWEFPSNQGWHASPMTYMFDNKQYVAIASGLNIIAFALPE
jgi:alpha-D-ribose 1-methylphosphonate 5-triphosphate synthase subunit PhnL